MPRITPTSGSGIIHPLEDDEPYVGSLSWPTDGPWSESTLNGKTSTQLTVDWVCEDGNRVRDWIGLRLGKSSKTGQVSKLRMLLNSLADKPRDTPVSFFDTDTLEWGYDDNKAFAKLREGLVVVFRGINGKKVDGSDKFTVQKYQAPKQRGAAATGAARVRPSSNDDDEIPF